MNSLELKQKIINKLDSVEDIYLLKRVMNTLQPISSNEIRFLNEKELEMSKEIDEDIKYGKSISLKQLNKCDSDWIYGL